LKDLHRRRFGPVASVNWNAGYAGDPARSMPSRRRVAKSAELIDEVPQTPETPTAHTDESVARGLNVFLGPAVRTRRVALRPAGRAAVTLPADRERRCLKSSRGEPLGRVAPEVDVEEEPATACGPTGRVPGRSGSFEPPGSRKTALAETSPHVPPDCDGTLWLRSRHRRSEHCPVLGIESRGPGHGPV